MVASNVGLGRDVAPHFALFKDEGHNFGTETVLSINAFLTLCCYLYSLLLSPES